MTRIDLHDTLGAAYVGNVFAACLYGLTTLQTYIYFTRSSRDHAVLQTLVGVLWSIDTLHVAFISHAVYQYAVSDFGDLIALLKPTWSILAMIFLTGLSDVIVRSIFVYRIWILSEKNIVLSIVLWFSTILTFGCSLAFPSKAFSMQDLTFASAQTISWILYLGLATAAFSDVLVSAALWVLLSRQRGRYGRIGGVVRTMMLYSINTCTLTSVCALAALIAFAASPHTFIYIAFYALLPKLFLNALLATLNARQSFREKLIGEGVQRLDLSSTTMSRELQDSRPLHASYLTNGSATAANKITPFMTGSPNQNEFEEPVNNVLHIT